MKTRAESTKATIARRVREGFDMRNGRTGQVEFAGKVAEIEAEQTAGNAASLIALCQKRPSGPVRIRSQYPDTVESLARDLGAECRNRLR